VATAASGFLTAHPTAAASTSSAPGDPARCAASVPDDGAERAIVVWHALGEAQGEMMRSAYAELDAANSGLSVELVRKDNYDMLLAELITTPRDRWPNAILGMEQSVMNLANLGDVIAPGECAAELTPYPLLPIVEATYSVDGELVAIPYNISTPVLVFNGALVRQAGLDPSAPPRTLAELRRAADVVVASGAAPSGLVVYDQYGPWFLRQFSAQRGEPIAVPDNGRSGHIDAMAIATPAVIADFEWLRDGLASGSFLWIGGNPSGFDDLVKLPTDGAQAAFTIHTSAALGDVLALVEQGVFPGSELGVAPLPGDGSLVGGGAWWLLDSGDPVVNRAAAEVVSALIAPDVLGAFDVATGYVPPSEAVAEEQVVLDGWASAPALRVGYDQLAQMDASAASAGLLATPSRTLDELLWYAAGDLLQPDVDVQALLEDVEDQFMSSVLETQAGE